MIRYPKDTTNRSLVGKIEKQPPLRKIAYEQLKSAILNGVLTSGKTLCETKISEEMGISRTPVREALHALERECLITGIDKVGYRVVDASPEDLDDISEIRKTVETLALRRAIERIGESEIKELEENLKKSANTVARRKPEQFVRLDAEFHSILISLSHSERLIRMADTLRQEMARFRSSLKDNLALAEAALRQHEKIMMFLKEKDRVNAMKALRNHIDHIRKGSKKVTAKG